MAKIKLEINSLAGCPLKDREMEKITRSALEKVIFPSKGKSFLLSLAFVAPQEIRKLNRTYRKKDKVTDVLSFANYPDTRSILSEKGKEVMLGELVVCFSFVKKSAKMNEISFRRELAFVLAHGALHLAGLDHGKKMFSLQDEAIQNIK